MIDIAGTETTPRATWGAEVRATLSLAWPLVVTNLAQVAFGLTDVIMMGWLGADALAAGALATNLNFAFVILGIGLLTATAPLIASELGRHRHAVREVRRTVRQGLWSAIVVALPSWLVLWHGEAILLLLGQQPHLATEAGHYLRTLMWSSLPFFGYIVLRNFVSSLERPLVATVVGLAGVPLNAVLVWALMFGRLGLPPLGLTGAGVGTTLANVFLFAGLAAAISLDRRFRRYHLFGRFWRADWPRFRHIWRLGVPIALAVGFEVTIFNASAFLMGLISATAVAAYSIAIQLAAFTFMVPLGLGNAATVRVGRAFGARDWRAATRSGWVAWWLAIVYACCTATLMLTCGRMLVGVFLDLHEAANRPVVDLAVTFLVFAGLFQVVDATQASASGMLRGLHDTRVPMVLAAIGYWGVALPLSVLLAFGIGLGGEGIWIGLSVGLAVVAVMLTIRWARRTRHLESLPQGGAVPATPH
ncbi:MAG: MATE family efflux transporter [Rhizobiales bacterium]|nr:MATE family efflux transporter [Hyphomicrobiales bacterium]